ncbi:hypothetical protein MUK42_12973 [Musa troglodytarum]|uniref:Uncharacterized protein n=1 Tax=Musa troglodytarum TaxID=320322 RepID=A0A9E7HD15_9LILI|nr:hypothetical protein MUK42_12973 [Musa troglodytarum]
MTTIVATLITACLNSNCTAFFATNLSSNRRSPNLASWPRPPSSLPSSLLASGVNVAAQPSPLPLLLAIATSDGTKATLLSSLLAVILPTTVDSLIAVILPTTIFFQDNRHSDIAAIVLLCNCQAKIFIFLEPITNK